MVGALITPEEMKPGTTFTAEFKGTDRRALFVKVGGKTQWPLIDVASGALATYGVEAIYQDTIRNVSEPREDA